MAKTITATATIDTAEKADIDLLDHIAKGQGSITPEEVREVARILAIVARGGNATVDLLKQIAAAGPIKVDRRAEALRRVTGTRSAMRRKV